MTRATLKATRPIIILLLRVYSLREHVSTKPVPSNDKGIFTEPLPSNDKGDTQTYTHRQQRDLMAYSIFSK
jgi:hypothetical protein